MDLNEYKNLRQAIRERAKTEEMELAREYAYSNNTVKIGDIITDHIGSIKVEKIQWGFAFSRDYSECIYTGIELKKDKTPTKRGNKRQIYQSNLVL